MAVPAATQVKRKHLFTATRTAYVRSGERLLRSGYDRIPDPDFALSKDSDFWEKIEGNATVRGARDYRRHLVSGPRVTLEAKTPLQEPLLPYVEALLQEIRQFGTARLGFADAPFRGHVAGRMFGHYEERDLIGDGITRRWFLLDKIRVQPKGRWELKRWKEEDGTVRFGWAVWSFGREAGEEGEPGWIVPENPEWYIHHFYGQNEEYLYGRDLARVLYWLAHAEHVLWEAGLDTAERFGAPWILAKLKQEIGAQTPESGSDIEAFRTTAQSILNVVEKLRANNVLVGDERLLDIDLLEAGLRGSDIVDRLIERIQQMVRILILGSNMPTAAVQGGSFALAQVQDESTRRLVRYDRNLLGETLTDQMLDRVLDWNRGALATIAHPDRPGITLADVGTPRVLISDDEVDDASQKEFRLRFAQAVALPIQNEELYSLGGFSPPAEGDSTTTVARTGGMGGGGMFAEHSPAWLEYAEGRLDG